MILSLLAGVVMGFLLSMPPMGPTNFAIMAKAFKHDVKAGIMIGAGAGFIDMVYILIAYGGVSFIIAVLPEVVTNFFAYNEHIIKIILTFGGCAIVVVYGLKIMRMKVLSTGESSEIEKKKLELASAKAKQSVDKIHKTEKELEKLLHHKIGKDDDSSVTGNFFTGIFLCLSSITLPAAWFAMVTYMKGYGVINSNFFSGLLFGIGVFGGTTLWFYLLTKFISSNSHKISPKTLGKINVSVGIILLALGAFLFYKAFDFALS